MTWKIPHPVELAEAMAASVFRVDFEGDCLQVISTINKEGSSKNHVWTYHWGYPCEHVFLTKLYIKGMFGKL